MYVSMTVMFMAYISSNKYNNKYIKDNNSHVYSEIKNEAGMMPPS